MTADEMREMQWVRPELVAQIRFVEWTAEGRLRHAAFLGPRSDKDARGVRRELPCLTVSVRARSGPCVVRPCLEKLDAESCPGTSDFGTHRDAVENSLGW